MKLSLFEYTSYRKYLNDLIAAMPNEGRGRRKAMAEEIGAQVSYVSTVLNGTAHFSPEQAEAITRHFGFSSEEAEYFVLLVQWERAGTPALRKFLLKQLTEKRNENSDLKARLQMPESLRSEQEARYYSSWQYALVHVALSIPKLQTRESLSSHLGLSQSRVDEILQFLQSTGLISKEGHRYLVVKPLLHLDRNSPLISKLHTNWRLKTMIALEDVKDEDLHYSSALTLSQEDFPRVREILTKALAEAMTVIKTSKEEHLAVMSLDFFSV